jgi:hypothetical protein
MPCKCQGPKEEMSYSSYSFLTLALDGVRGQRHTLATLYHWGKNHQHPLDRRQVWKLKL